MSSDDEDCCEIKDKNALSGDESSDSTDSDKPVKKVIKPRPVKVREKKFICELCSKGFPARRDLVRHMRVYKDHKSYTCEVCDKSFENVHSLKNHKRWHNDKKSYKCKRCSKTFLYISAFKKHLKMHSEPPFQCEVCEKFFPNDATLLKHERAHRSEEGRIKCEVCSQEFKRKTYYMKHVALHG